MEEETLLEVKRRVKELEQHLEYLSSRFTADRDWTTMLQMYSLAATTLRDIQEKISAFELYAAAPDYREHDEKELVPDLLNAQCFEQDARKQAIESQRRELSLYTDADLDSKVAHFNAVCHALQALFKPRN